MNATELWQFWEKLLIMTQTKFDPDIWSNYIQTGLFPRYLKNNRLVIGSANIYIKNFFDKNNIFKESLTETASQIYGKPLIIEIILNEIASTEQQHNPPEIIENTTAPIMLPTDTIDDIDNDFYPPEVIISRSSLKPEKQNPLLSHNINISTQQESKFEQPQVEVASNRFETSHVSLNNHYTFDSFITGNSNRIAYSAAQAVAEMPGQKYNPLFIYGPPGLGKTHLMHAIGNYVKENHPNLKVICATSEDFLNDLINAIKSKQNESFRERYRNVDVLLLDDIQFLQQKEYIKEEFFHTFNALINDNKQIVLISDKPPKDLTHMEERLRSRFEWGFVSTIDFPDLETRIAILRHLAEKEAKTNNLPLVPNDVINYIASIFDKNIRSLEGAFNKVLVSASISHEKITKEYALEILKDSIDNSSNKQLSYTYIQDFIATYFKIKKEDLMSKKRTKHLAHARQIAMYICRELLNDSYPQISSYFNKKDHTTSLHAYEKILKEIETDAETKRMVEEIMNELSK